MKKIIACISIICYTLLCYSQNQTTDNNYRTQKNISYLHPGEKDSYKLERCKLDLHYPTDKKGFATLIWFHGYHGVALLQELLRKMFFSGFQSSAVEPDNRMHFHHLLYIVML